MRRVRLSHAVCIAALALVGCARVCCAAPSGANVTDDNASSHDTMASDNVSLALLLSYTVLVSFISCAVNSLTSFGKAILYHIFFELLHMVVPSYNYDITEVVSLILVSDVVTTFPLFWITRKEVNWKLFAVIMPTDVGVGVLGTYLLVTAPPQALKTGLGVVFVVFSVWRIGLELTNTSTGRTLRDRVDDINRRATSDGATRARPGACESFLGRVGGVVFSAFPRESGHKTAVTEMTKPILIGAFVAGCGAGLLRGLFGVGGPPLMVFVALSNIDKGTMRGTMTAEHSVALIGTAVYLLYFRKRFHPARWPQYLVMIAAGLAGVWFGNWLHRRSHHTTVMRTIIMLLLTASVTMLSLPFPVTISILSVVLIGGTISIYIGEVRARRDEGGPSTTGPVLLANPEMAVDGGIALGELRRKGSDSDLEGEGDEDEEGEGGTRHPRRYAPVARGDDDIAVSDTARLLSREELEGEQ